MDNNYSNNFLLVDQTAVLYKASLISSLSNIFAAWLIYVLVYNTPHETNAFLLGITMTVLNLIRGIIINDYQKENRLNLTLNTSLFVYLVFALLIGISWAIFQYAQVFHDDDVIRNMIFLINFGMIAGAVGLVSVWFPAYVAYVFPQAIAIFAVFVILKPGTGYYVAMTFAIFIILMTNTGFHVNRSRKQEIVLTHNNKQLIDDLNSEIHIRESVQLELEVNKAELENKVEIRTKELIETNSSLKDVLAKKEEAEESLQYLAYHDELTGLPNKNLLIDRISQSIKISSRDSQQMAILFLDLDRFKTINDSLGHIIGDKLLKEVASRLISALRNHDTISRNGGDEFVVVLEKLKSHNEAVSIAKKVIECLTLPFEIESHTIHIGASVGISVYPFDGEMPLILLRNADTAMYRAKQAGGKQLQFYDASMSNQLRDRLELENELHRALENNEFYMVYQPQVSASTGMTIGAESLIRWNNPAHGEVAPDRFVPLLEDTGLIYSVGQWIVKEVIKFVQTQNRNEVKFSINLSALQCSNSDFADYVESQLEKYNVPAHRIEFEITESLLIHDFNKTKVFLDKLHTLGCTIALDDFGTGYTSMSYLSRLPIDVVKIDKSLIRNISENENLKSIVTAIVTMSQSLGLKNVFEGIETEDELAEIKKLNGEIIQGYIFSKPLNEIDTVAWLQSQECRKKA
jgi:diguanylate cyclase (GGDEF)-like protein